MTGPFRRSRRMLGVMSLGWALTGLGTLILAVTTAQSNPELAGPTARAVATAAFAAAQMGLLIVAVQVFRQLHARAARLQRRK